MNKFEVVQPSLLLAPYVKQYWFLTLENVAYNSQRIVPFGCSALSFYKGNRTFSLLENDYLPQSHFFGIATNFLDISLPENIDFICVVFQPAGARAFFNTPLIEFNKSYLSLDSLQDKELCELEKSLNDTTDTLVSVGFIEQFLFDRIYQLDQYKEKRISTAITSICQGVTDVNSLAHSTCLSYKQFNRLFSECIGTNPKDYIQIVRFQKLYHLMQQHSGKTLDQLSGECGYYDKFHLIKNLRKFSGFTPSEFEKVCDPTFSSYHSLFRSAFIDL